MKIINGIKTKKADGDRHKSAGKNSPKQNTIFASKVLILMGQNYDQMKICDQIAMTKFVTHAKLCDQSGTKFQQQI